MCCFCVGVCSHVGPHAYCEAHRLSNISPVPTMPQEQAEAAVYRGLYSREVAKKVALELEVLDLKRQLSAREDEVALMQVIATDLREVAHQMVQDARRLQ